MGTAELSKHKVMLSLVNTSCTDIYDCKHADQIGDYRPLITIIDQIPHRAAAHPVKAKFPFSVRSRKYMELSGRNGRIVNVLCTEDGADYISNKMYIYLSDRAISVTRTCTETSQQTSIAELMNRNLLNMVKCIL